MINNSVSNIIHVPSGNYVVKRQTKIILEAHLGTCVGVTLVDREAKVGGLIHILLPRPTAVAERPQRPKVYASTGLPLFIRDLCKAGAAKKRLEACVAGGSLIGPVSKQDLDLDIGGNTTNVVHEILRGEKIPVIKSETGGYSGYRFSLDLNTLEALIHPIGYQDPSAETYFQKPTSEDISRVVNSVRPIPQIALKIARMIQDGNYNMNAVSGEIKQDQVISASIIRLCNSTFTGLKKKVGSIDRALVIMGEKILFQLVISACLQQSFSEYGQGYSLSKGGLFQHALGTAIVAEELAKYTGKASSDTAYTAGLLHDIGKVVLDQYISSAYPFFYRKTSVDGIDLCEAEKEKIGIDHTEAGALLAENWFLPEELIDTIKYHHYPEGSTVNPELTHLVYLSDLLMSRFQAGLELECINMDMFSSRLQKLGLKPSELPVVVDLMPKRIFEATL